MLHRQSALRATCNSIINHTNTARRNFSSSSLVSAPTSGTVNTEKWAQQLNASLKDTDPEMFDIIEHEKNRQYKGLQLIPSEVSSKVMMIIVNNHVSS